MMISVDVAVKEKNNENIKYGIVFDDESILNFIFVPSDYTMEEFAQIICNYYRRYLNTKIIIDKNGLGKSLLDTLIACGMNPDDIITVSSPSKYSECISIGYVQGTEKIIDYAMESNFNTIGKIEFKKLKKEMENIEPLQKANGKLQLERKDKNIGKVRANCYMQYIAFTEGIFEDI